MAEYIAGQSMVLSWIYSGGTIALAGDYRTCTWTPTINFVDATAGADTYTSRMAGIKDATASITLVQQTGGTVIVAALQPGTPGTLLIQPEGTATGKRKINFPCYSDGATYDHPYESIVTISCGFSCNNSAGTLADTVN